MTSEKQELKNNGKGISGLVFVGCLMIGLAAGFLIGNFAVGVLGGVGVGFIGMAVAMATSKQDSMRKGISGLVFVGCLILGLAIGMFLGNIVVGLFGGLGIGFIAMYIAYNATGEW